MISFTPNMMTKQQTPRHNVSRNKPSARKVAKRKVKYVPGKLNTSIKLTDNGKSEDPSTYDRPLNLPTLSANGKEIP